ncbi:MAG: hypothetical protein KKC76_21045 [Proteobacteria bacterium]|nr:hypothetical protein [Pseudomonadota bacterium]
MKKILGLLITILFISAQYSLALAAPKCEDPSMYKWDPKTQTCIEKDKKNQNRNQNKQGKDNGQGGGDN